MSDFRQVAAFAAGLYRQRADIAYAGYLRRDPMALLVLRPGRVDPYAIYDRLRRGGPLTPTRLGNWVSTSHPVCDSVLRDRASVARLEATIALRMLAERMPGLVRAGTVKRRNATTIRGPVRVPVTPGPALRPAAGHSPTGRRPGTPAGSRRAARTPR